ncbi:hypothetical protein ABZX95_48770 [Streptomyces sp. NPDC004232]|uniref:hypothetical protein n=1 Tax=Streptomyces sp. NPDC004232 TaxID=3154454 RepID=UPI0033A70B79
MAQKAKGKGDKRWVRWLAVYVRHKTWAAYDEMKNGHGELSEIPKAFATSVRRTAVGTSLLLLLGASAGASLSRRPGRKVPHPALYGNAADLRSRKIS